MENMTKKTFNAFRIREIVGDLYCILSSNLGSNREIVQGSTYLGSIYWKEWIICYF
jgi:hypothetical protein